MNRIIEHLLILYFVFIYNGISKKSQFIRTMYFVFLITVPADPTILLVK